MTEFLLENGQPNLKKIKELVTKIKIPFRENDEFFMPLKYSLYREYCLRANRNLSIKDFVKEKFPNLPKKYCNEIILAMRV